MKRLNDLSKLILLNGRANSKAGLLLMIHRFPLNFKSTLNVWVPIHKVHFRECEQHVVDSADFFLYTHTLVEVFYDPFVPLETFMKCSQFIIDQYFFQGW